MSLNRSNISALFLFLISEFWTFELIWWLLGSGLDVLDPDPSVGVVTGGVQALATLPAAVMFFMPRPSIRPRQEGLTEDELEDKQGFIKKKNRFHPFISFLFLGPSPRRSRSTEATPTHSSVDRRAASDWTRSRPGPPDPDRTPSTRSRWGATGRHGNLLARRKRPACLWPARPGSRCTAGRKDKRWFSKKTQLFIWK